MIRIAIILAAALFAILAAQGHGASLESVAVKHGKKFGDLTLVNAAPKPTFTGFTLFDRHPTRGKN